MLEADGYQPYLISPEKGLRSLIKGVLELAKEPSRFCVDEVIKCSGWHKLFLFLFPLRRGRLNMSNFANILKDNIQCENNGALAHCLKFSEPP